ncbi:TolB-like translocation protein [Mesoterricola sediminis]|uniref:Uncharacterized protein n=1 Tax=Mesoterricola sediminis TaxID=2927980 RepID=A0AA48GQM4_9BACT|nr:hypothetical protein [Mesoterricola sediminis]BDU77471.1 hypothetical protein METESE_24290 [Mesoterricola sediminis]
MTQGGANLRQRLAPWALGAVALALMGAAILDMMPARPAPAFLRLDMPRGSLESAFFGPDGRTVYVSVRVGGKEPESFALAPDGDGYRGLGPGPSRVVGVSPEGQPAFLRNLRRSPEGLLAGQLADRAGRPLAEGDGVLDAAWWAPGWARLRLAGGRLRLEHPSGRVLVEADAAQTTLTCLRVDPTGRQIAFIATSPERTAVHMVREDGRDRELLIRPAGAPGPQPTGLAWGPDGRLWISEWEGDQTSLWAVAGWGGRKLIWRGDGLRQLLDVAPDGRFLLANQRIRRRVILVRGGTSREFSLFEGTQAAGLSSDGRTLLLLESPVLGGGLAQDRGYLWREGEEAPAQLGQGRPVALWPAGDRYQCVLAHLRPEVREPRLGDALRDADLEAGHLLASDPRGQRTLCILPTAQGRGQVLSLPEGFQALGPVHPAGEALLLAAQGPAGKAWYRWVPEAGAPVALGPFLDGTGAVARVSPDGQHLAVPAAGGGWRLLAAAPSAIARPVRGLREGERVVGWTADSRGLLVASPAWALPLTLARLDPDTGARTPGSATRLPDVSGHQAIPTVWATPGGGALALTCERRISELFRVEGVGR